MIHLPRPCAAKLAFNARPKVHSCVPVLFANCSCLILVCFVVLHAPVFSHFCLPIQTFGGGNPWKIQQTLKSIKSDVTRHRYGDEAHLDTTVKFLGLVMPQSDYPQLQYISEVCDD